MRQRSVENLAGIPADKIYLVQLSDLDKQPEICYGSSGDERPA
ncbi:hypothetical protein ACZ87_00524 [Candidatus Erwinia dacicola]|uniref:Uncharacterized protein n=1 Tax=Candidatus Erwinia dacicola TaxID=252393 RepID=A0A328TY39_9GAMM|nr:hypothetical protein [Candidatus Erwinia dacicola]RAP72666.1 hypothetical protein ACZ87_00524 [Candidatus Erwinia dacicola]